MRKQLVAAVLAVTAWAGAAGSAWGQALPYGPSNIRPYDLYNQPALSPYLNLARPGSPSANLYLGVYPEFQRRAFENNAIYDIQGLDRRTARNRDLIDDLLAGQPLIRTLPPTGHPTAFQNYGTYFGTLNRR
jgi:hypothetical protein